ncbi:MAG TPA: 2-amino-3-carboxymuconate-6-semialdehyde decarboxylase [Acidobacteria bacterium]|nr:2-amino-3-carboxymuconate-6-semialdehyde decarboxylase [Acidobacteriota bacterium]
MSTQMYRPATITDSHIHLSTAGTARARRTRLSQLDERLVEAYHGRWSRSLASRDEQGPETDVPDVETVARRWLAELDAAGIDRAVFFPAYDAPDDLLAFIASAPDRFVGYTTFDPTNRENAHRLQQQVDEGGVRGLKLYPMAGHFHADDDACFPVYEVCADKGIPVIIHFGISIDATHDLRYGNPLDLSHIALRFPSVRWIIPHFGTGFFREALMLAAQYQNVYLDTSSSNNWVQYAPVPTTVADLFRRTLDALGSERLIFGTDSSFFPRGFRTNILEQQLAICNDLNLSPAEMDNIFNDNIRRIIDG